MKKISNTSIIAFALAFFLSLVAVSGCQSDLMFYSGQTGIYIAMPSGDTTVNADTTYTETSSLPFIILPQDQQTAVFNLKIKIIGSVSDKDREVGIRIVENESDVSSGDYDPVRQTYILKAGSVYGVIPIVFHREGFRGKEKKMVVELVPTDDFSLPITSWRNSPKEYVSVYRHTITVSDKYVQLPGYVEGHFGKFSQKKMELICHISGKNLEYFNKKLPVTETKAIGQKLDRYLREQTPPLRDEYGEVMTAGKYIY